MRYMSLLPLLGRNYCYILFSTGRILPNYPSLSTDPGGKASRHPSLLSVALCLLLPFLHLWFLHSWESCPLLLLSSLPNDSCFSPSLLCIYASLGSSSLQHTASEIFLNRSGVERKQHKPPYSAALTPSCLRGLFSLSEQLGTDPFTEALA